MGDAANTVGFIVILVLYASVGVLAVIGSAVVTQTWLAPKWEQMFYAGFLMAIAAFYLAFAAYFDAHQAWEMEASAVLAFCAIAAVGARSVIALSLGYLVHGVWDLLHELQAHGGPSVFEPGQATAIPLAYGAFCATFDVGIVIYFYLRREAWKAAGPSRTVHADA